MDTVEVHAPLDVFCANCKRQPVDFVIELPATLLLPALGGPERIRARAEARCLSCDQTVIFGEVPITLREPEPQP